MIVGQDNVAAARTTFETLVNGALDQQRAQGAWQAIATRAEGGSSNAYNVTVNGATPTFQKWVGEKSFGGFRKLSTTVVQHTYHQSIDIARKDVVYDQGGSTAARMRTFLNDAGYVWDKISFELLMTNPTCVDGVSLINSAHPFGANGATWSNSTANALSYAEFDAGLAALASLEDEYGAPMTLRADTLIVHPDSQRLALEIAAADTKPISDGSTGTTSITNVFQGMVKVIVSPYMTSGDWLLVDSRFPPLQLVVWRDPEAVIADDMAASERMRNDMFLYSVEADAGVGAVEPYAVYGKIS